MINENRAPLRKPRQRLQRGGETKAQQVLPELLNISRPSSAKQRLKSLNLIYSVQKGEPRRQKYLRFLRGTLGSIA